MELPVITDEFMQAMRPTTRAYTLLLLKRTPRLADPEAFPTLWEHGRRNYALREAGLLSIACPMPDDANRRDRHLRRRDRRGAPADGRRSRRPRRAAHLHPAHLPGIPRDSLPG